MKSVTKLWHPIFNSNILLTIHPNSSLLYNNIIRSPLLHGSGALAGETYTVALLRKTVFICCYYGNWSSTGGKFCFYCLCLLYTIYEYLPIFIMWVWAICPFIMCTLNSACYPWIFMYDTDQCGSLVSHIHITTELVFPFPFNGPH